MPSVDHRVGEPLSLSSTRSSKLMITNYLTKLRYIGGTVDLFYSKR